VLGDLASDDAVDVHALYRHRPAGRRYALELPEVLAPNRHASHDLVAFGEDVVESMALTWEGRVEDGNHPLRSLEIERWHSGKVHDPVGRNHLLEYLVDSRYSALVERFIKAAHKSLVLFGGHAA
jgi:hypothetical protein